MERHFNSDQGGHGNGNSYKNGRSHYGTINGSGRNGRPESDSNAFEIDFRQLYRLFRRYRTTIIGITLSTAVIFGLVSYVITPVYKSEGLLLISEPSTNSSTRESGISAMISSMYGIGIRNTIDNELEILRSRSLSEEIADELINEKYLKSGEQYPLLWRDYPADSSVVSRDTIAIRIRENIGFTQANENSNVIEISFESRSPEEAARIVNMAMSTYSDLSTRQNRRTARSAVEFLRDERQRVENNLSEAEQELRNFMNTTKLLDVDRQTEELISRISTLEADRQTNMVNLESVNSAIEQYEQRVAELGPGLENQLSSAFGPKLTRYQYQLAELETEKMLLLSRNPDIERLPDPPRELVKLNQEIQNVKGRIQELTAELKNESSERIALLGDRDGNGVLQSITDLHQRLIDLKTERNQYRSQNEILDQRLAEEQQFFDNLPNNRIEFARLQRSVEINERLYRNLSEQYAEMQLLEQTRFGLGRVVDRGHIPTEAEQPKPILFIIGGLFMGGLIGIGYMGLSELFNYKIDRLDKVKKFNIPVLSVIPGLKPYVEEQHSGCDYSFVGDRKFSTRLVTFFDNDSKEAESFRWLLNNLIYSQQRDEELKSVMITSSRSEEDKSIVTANLGLVLAESGRKVLMIDADWRTPGLHHLFGLNQSPGIIEIVPDCSDLTNIQQTVVDGLDLLAAGRVPPGLTMVNKSSRLREVIESLKKEYDIVLMKTAPFGIYADAASLIENTDGAIVTARFGSTSVDELEVTIGNLQQVNANILGMVLTSYDSEMSVDTEPVNKPHSFSRTFFKRNKSPMDVNNFRA